MLKCRNMHSATEKATYWFSNWYCAGLCHSNTQSRQKEIDAPNVVGVEMKTINMATMCINDWTPLKVHRPVNLCRESAVHPHHYWPPLLDTTPRHSQFMGHFPELLGSHHLNISETASSNKWPILHRYSSFENNQFPLARTSQRWPHIPNCWGFRMLLMCIVTKSLLVWLKFPYHSHLSGALSLGERATLNLNQNYLILLVHNLLSFARICRHHPIKVWYLRHCCKRYGNVDNALLPFKSKALYG